MMQLKHPLSGGPLDGCKVTRAIALPIVIYCRRTPNDDGFQPWSEEPSERFCTRYEMDDDGEFEFIGYATPIVGVPVK